MSFSIGEMGQLNCYSDFWSIVICIYIYIYDIVKCTVYTAVLATYVHTHDCGKSAKYEKANATLKPL